MLNIKQNWQNFYKQQRNRLYDKLAWNMHLIFYTKSIFYGNKTLEFLQPKWIICPQQKDIPPNQDN